MNKSKFFWIAPVAVLLLSFVYFAFTGFGEADNYITGIVEANEIDVAAKIPGRIDTLRVDEGSMVKKGDIIAVLESKEIDAKVGQAKAAVKAAQAKLGLTEEGARREEIDAYEQLYFQAKHQYEFAEKSWNRINKLYQDSVVSAQVKDETEFKYNAAKAQMEATKAKYTIAQNGARSGEIDAVKALTDQAQNAYNEAMAYREELELKSPVTGEISAKLSDQGEVIAAGYPVFTVKEENSEYVVIHLREDYMKNIKTGAKMNGNITALGKENVEFRVTYIAPMADFASWRPTNQKGDFDLKTFEVKLKPVNKTDGLRPGMTVNFDFSTLNAAENG